MATPAPDLQSIPSPDVLKCGYLRKQKTTHKRFFVLRGPDQTSSAGRLEYYESERKFRHKSAPKRSVALDSCFNISKRADARNKHMVALYTKDEYLAVAAENETEQDAWYRAITELHARGRVLQHEQQQQQCDHMHHHHHHHQHHPQQQQQSLYPHAESAGESEGSPRTGDEVYGVIAPSSAFKEVWQVNLKPRGLGQTRNMFGVYRLCLSSRKISFVKLNSEKPDVTLQLMNVRRCGHSESFFFIEVGRSAVTGPGEFWMQVEDCVVAQNMHETILEAMKAMSEFSEFRPRSKSHSASSSSNPISVPPRRHLNSLPPSQTGLSRRSRNEGGAATHGGTSSPANNNAATAVAVAAAATSNRHHHPLNGGVPGTAAAAAAAGGHNFRARTSSEGERTIAASRPSSVGGSPVSVSPTPPRLQQQQQQGVRGCLVNRTSSRLQAVPLHSRYVTVPAPGASQPPSSAVSPVSCASSTSPSSSGPSSGRGSSASDALLLLYVKVNGGGGGGGGGAASVASASGSPSDGGFASSSDEYGSSPVDARRQQGLLHRSATPESLSRTPPPIREEQDDDGHSIHHHHHHHVQQQQQQQQVNNYINMGKGCAQNGHHHHHHHHHQQQQLHRGVLLARRASQDENAGVTEAPSEGAPLGDAGAGHRKRPHSCTSPPHPAGLQQPPPHSQQQQHQRKPSDDYALMNLGSLTSSGSGSSYTGSSYTSRSASPRPPVGPAAPRTAQAALHLQHSYPEDYGEIHVGGGQRPGATCKDDGYMPMSPGVAPVPSASSRSSPRSVASGCATAPATLCPPGGGGPSDDYVPMSPKSVSAPQEILNPRRRRPEVADPSGYMVMSPGANNGSCSPECSPYMKMWSSSKLSVCSTDGKAGDVTCEYMNMSPGLAAGTPPDYFFTPTSAEPPKVSCYYYSLPRSFKPGPRKDCGGGGGGGGARFSPSSLSERQQLFGGDKSSSTSSDSLGHDADQLAASGSSPGAAAAAAAAAASTTAATAGAKTEPRKLQQQQQQQPGLARPTRLSLGGLKSSTLPRTYECPPEPVSPGEYVNIEFGDGAQAVVDAQRKLSASSRLAAAQAGCAVGPDWGGRRAAAATGAAAAVVSPLAAARVSLAGVGYEKRPVQNGDAGSDYAAVAAAAASTSSSSAVSVGGVHYGARVNPGAGGAVDYASLQMGRGRVPLEQETEGDYTEMRFGVTSPAAAPSNPAGGHCSTDTSKMLTSPTSRLNRLSLMDQMTAAHTVPNPDQGAKVIRADAQGRRRHSSETFASTASAAALGSGGISPAMPTFTSLLSPSFAGDAARLCSASFESVYVKDAQGGPAVGGPAQGGPAQGGPAVGDAADCGGVTRESGFENGLNYVALELSSDECQRAAAAAAAAASTAAATAASTAGLDVARGSAKVTSIAMDSAAYASIDFARSDAVCPPAHES